MVFLGEDDASDCERGAVIQRMIREPRGQRAPVDTTLHLMLLRTGLWRALHDAKNELAGAMLLLGRARAGAAIDLRAVETLIRRAAMVIDDIPCGESRVDRAARGADR